MGRDAGKFGSWGIHTGAGAWPPPQTPPDHPQTAHAISFSHHTPISTAFSIQNIPVYPTESVGGSPRCLVSSQVSHPPAFSCRGRVQLSPCTSLLLFHPPAAARKQRQSNRWWNLQPAGTAHFLQPLLLLLLLFLLLGILSRGGGVVGVGLHLFATLPALLVGSLPHNVLHKESNNGFY